MKGGWGSMRRGLRLISAVSLSSVLLMGVAVASPDTEYEIVVEAGYRVDDLDWNIAGFNSTDITVPNQQRSDQYVNVLSELKWNDVQIAQAGVSYLGGRGRLFLKGRLFYGDVLDGKNQDSDYDYDNRQGEFSRSNNGVFGNVLDANISMGYRYEFGDTGRPKLYLMPTIGAALHIQRFGMDDGYQTLLVPYAEGLAHPQAGIPDASAVGSFANLNSTYDTRWTSSWLGVDLWRDMTPELTLLFSLELHMGDFSAKADWNLRDDLAHPVSFRHWADSQGVRAAAEGRYKLSGNKFLSFELSHQNWNTDPGVDTVYASDGDSASTRLNEVNWKSTAFNVGLGWLL